VKFECRKDSSVYPTDSRNGVLSLALSSRDNGIQVELCRFTFYSLFPHLKTGNLASVQFFRYRQQWSPLAMNTLSR
jgi:hypothetical protein